MGKTERKDGYYWVRLGGSWEPALWLGGSLSYWKIVGVGYETNDNAFYEIGPRIPEYKPKKRKK